MIGKRFLLLGAPTLTTALHATTISWQDVGTPNDKGCYTLTHKGDNTQRAIRFNFSLTGSPTSGCLLAYGADNSNNYGIRLRYDSGKLIAEMKPVSNNTRVDAYTTVTGVTPALKQGKNEIVIAMERVREHNTSAIFINGIKCFTLTESNQQGFDWNRAKFGAPFSVTEELTALAGGTLSDFAVAEVYETTIQDVSDYYASVPEPTALALLALGVAGLALRRRVA